MPYSVQLDQPATVDISNSSWPRAAGLETRTFSWCSRNYDLDAGLDQGFVDFQTVILDQDRLVVESQRPEELPVDLSEEPTSRASIMSIGIDGGLVSWRHRSRPSS